MNYSQDQILQDVRLTLDQNQVETDIPLGTDLDTLELNDIIKSKTIEAARHILLVAPLRMIDEVNNFTTTQVVINKTSGGGLSEITSDDTSTAIESEDIVTDENGKASLVIPSDYLRLSLIQMEDWEIPIRKAVLDDTEVRMMIASSFTGIKPNIHRPMVVETQVAGVPTLEMYGSASVGVKFLQAQYIPYPIWQDVTIDNAEVTGLKFSSLLYDALVNYTAGLTAMVYNAPNAMNFISIANQYMGMQQQEQQTKGK